MECSISRSIAVDETSSYWSASKSSLFLGFSLVTTRRVVHLPKRTETSLISESDLSGPNHRIGPGCAGRALLV